MNSNPNRFCRTTAFPRLKPRSPAPKTKRWSCARALGYPVVLKIFSQTITHKTDVGGVKLNLEDEPSVRSAFQEIKSSVAQKVGPDHFSGVTVQPMVRLEGYELILGSSVDPQFGPGHPVWFRWSAG